MTSYERLLFYPRLWSMDAISDEKRHVALCISKRTGPAVAGPGGRVKLVEQSPSIFHFNRECVIIITERTQHRCVPAWFIRSYMHMVYIKKRIRREEGEQV